MSGTLTLAAAIAAFDRGALESLVLRRRPQGVSGVHDPIGLASELLRADSIERALVPLDRASLAILLAPEGADEDRLAPLEALGLIGRRNGTPVPLPEVAAVLRSGLLRVGASAEELSDPPPDEAARTGEAARSGDAADTSAWYATALSAVAAAAETLRALAEQPGRLNRNGTIAVATAKSLSEVTGVDPERTTRTLRILVDAGLVRPAPEASLLTVSSDARRWLGLGHVARWIWLARAVVGRIPEPLRTLLDEYVAHREGDPAGVGGLGTALAELPHRFPLLSPLLRETAVVSAEDAEQLGLTVEGTLSGPALALLSGDETAASAIAEHDMPAAVPGVYIQPDLSVVVPGPLSPADEAALAAVSRPEHVGVASTRRITEATLAAALERGATSEKARSALERLSLTGIPQPLDYLLNSAAERARSIVVSEHDGDEGRTRLVVSRPELLSTLLVDRALQHLQFARGERPDTLHSRLRPEHVIAALSDARYLTSFAGGAPPGGQLEADRSPGLSAAAPEAAVPPGASDADVGTGDARAGETARQRLSPELAQLVDRVLHAATAGAADFTRLLELAIRDRSRVRVTASAQGQTRSFTLQPVSLDAGRLRATDPAAGVERTLPVSTITAVESV